LSLFVERGERGRVFGENAAVDGQFDAGDEGGFVAGEEEASVGDFLGATETPERGIGDHRVGYDVVLRLDQRRPDNAGMDRIHPDVVGGIGDRGVLAHGAHGAFRRLVGSDAGHANDAPDRRDVDDRARRGFAHRRYDGAHADEDAGPIDGDHFCSSPQSSEVNRVVAENDAGIVDENVDLVVFGEDPVDNACPVFDLGHVEGLMFDVAACASLCRLLQVAADNNGILLSE
jgi:hypothetical protein